MTSTAKATLGDKINAFMKEAHTQGMAVYFATTLRITKVGRKHVALTRARKGHFQVLQRKQG
jgi:hypothetical protein